MGALPSASDVHDELFAAMEPACNEARTVPRPVLHDGRRALVVLHFLQPTLVRKTIFYVPHARTIVDRASLQLLVKKQPFAPAELGVPDPPYRRVAGHRLPGSIEDFWSGRQASIELSGDVWDDFFEGRSGPEVDERARRYAEAVHLSTFAALVPYLKGAAPEFARWLKEHISHVD